MRGTWFPAHRDRAAGVSDRLSFWLGQRGVVLDRISDVILPRRNASIGCHWPQSRTVIASDTPPGTTGSKDAVCGYGTEGLSHATLTFAATCDSERRKSGGA